MVHFVGAGPGAPDLITRRGAALLADADCIIYAGSLVNPALLGLAGADCAIYNSAEMTLEEAKTRHELIKTEKTRFEVKRLQGEMVFASDVIALGQEIVGGVKNNLLHIPTTLAPVLCNMDDAEEIESVLTQAIREALEDMSRLETWQPPDVDPGTLEDEEDEEDRKWENE